MAHVSAGLLMYRKRGAKLEVLLVHPGGPFWQNKDDGVWSIPKGEVAEGEDLLDAAKREFAEETGFTPAGQFIPLKAVKQKSGKIVHAWAVEGDLNTAAIRSNSFTMEWPPKSGKLAEFPEVDRAEFFDLETAKKKINPAQAAFVTELESQIIEPLGRSSGAI
jgi:predicted NUDIX family NTP pyrophosphohydrolase